MKDPVIGGTVYWLNEVMDGGPIAAQDWCWLYDGDTPQDVWRDRLFPMGVRLLGEVLADVPRFFAGKLPQDERAATFEPAMNPPRAYRPDLLGLPAPR
jgi:methionyl-tRNA formyltransferase